MRGSSIGNEERIRVRDPEICGREVEWHRDVLCALEEGQGCENCVWNNNSNSNGSYGSYGERCSVCGLGRVVDPVVVCSVCGAVGCRVCVEAAAAATGATTRTGRKENNSNEEECGSSVCKCRCRHGGKRDGRALSEAVLGAEGEGEGDADAIAEAAAELRRELEAMAAAVASSAPAPPGGSEETRRVWGWIEEALGTLGSVEAGVKAVGENRCVSWEAAWQTLRGAGERVQHIQDMLA